MHGGRVAVVLRFEGVVEVGLLVRVGRVVGARVGDLGFADRVVFFGFGVGAAHFLWVSCYIFFLMFLCGGRDGDINMCVYICEKFRPTSGIEYVYVRFLFGGEKKGRKIRGWAIRGERERG